MKRLLLINLLLPFLLLGTNIPQTGTLIVTYQTNQEGERIDRIRFWLKNEKAKQILYPRGDTYVDDKENNTRMVVINHLTPGLYSLEFLVPNLDQRFAPIPKKTVKIARGEVVKIDQEIKTRRGYWSSLEKVPEKIQTPEQHSSVDQAQIPEEKQTTEPEIVKEFISQTSDLDSQTEELEDEREEEENLSYGKLIVSFDLQEEPALAKNIRFRLKPSTGETTTHPVHGHDTEIPLQAGKMVMLQNLSVGSYEIEFFIEGQNEILASKPFKILANRTKSIHQALEIHPLNHKEETPSPIEEEVNKKLMPTLTLTANIPTAEFILIHTKSGETYEGKGREVSFDKLPTGTYNLHLNSYDPFFIPPGNEMITINPDETLTKEVAYITLGKVKISTNISQATAQITPMEASLPRYKKEVLGGEVTLYLPEGRYRITFNQVRGRKIPEPVDIDVQPLETEHINAYFSEN